DVENARPPMKSLCAIESLQGNVRVDRHTRLASSPASRYWTLVHAVVSVRGGGRGRQVTQKACSIGLPDMGPLRLQAAFLRRAQKVHLAEAPLSSTVGILDDHFVRIDVSRRQELGRCCRQRG